ncbi:hypothetical protein MYX84_15450 [Acidobacteria bacterium AH-259-O06]|nr:hypothetical protein [Acidobacteria bacterium AH-259-O06]
MILKLDKDYRINCDMRNFILQKRTNPNRGPKTRNGKKLKKDGGGWRDLGYWKDLSPLLLSYSRIRTRTSMGGYH